MKRETDTVLPRVLHAGVIEPFPDVSLADAEGLVAIGGDLSEPRLRLAYDSGIFPCYGTDSPPLWWCPDPRGVLPPDSLRVSRRLERQVRQGRFKLTWNHAFRQVMEACDTRPYDSSWILPEMIDAYEQLHQHGLAHSLEVWSDERLVGGIYGVQRGSLFAAESMFHRKTNMSKIALVALARTVAHAGIELIDVQYLTPHLARLGALEWPRTRYIAALQRLTNARVSPLKPRPLIAPLGE